MLFYRHGRDESSIKNIRCSNDKRASLYLLIYFFTATGAHPCIEEKDISAMKAFSVLLSAVWTYCKIKGENMPAVETFSAPVFFHIPPVFEPVTSFTVKVSACAKKPFITYKQLYSCYSTACNNVTLCLYKPIVSKCQKSGALDR